jgi:hypothetical protein
MRAAEDGLDGNPGGYRDHVIPRPGYRPSLRQREAGADTQQVVAEAGVVGE